MNLRDAYCAQLGLRPDEFEKAVLSHCLHPRARWLWRVYPAFFARDIAFLHEIGKCTDVSEIQVELDYFQLGGSQSGIFRGKLQMRMSGQKLVNLAARTLKQER